MKTIEQVHEYVIKNLNKLNIDFQEVSTSITTTPNGVRLSIEVYKKETFDNLIRITETELKYLVKRFDFEAELVNEKQKK